MKKKKFVIKNSLGMFDLLKGFVMILVVVIHTNGLMSFLDGYQTLSELLNNVNIFLLVFALIINLLCATLPALFIISGYGFRKTTNKKCIIKQFKTLVIPYLITLIITTIIHFFSYLFLYSGVKSSLKQTISIFLGGLFAFPTNKGIHDFWMLACGPIWYLAALVVATFVFNVLVNHFEGKKLFVSVLLTMCIGWILSFVGPLPFSISQALVAVFYLWLGYYIKRNKLLITPIKKKYRFGIAVVIIIYAVYANVTKYFDMAMGQYPLGPGSILVNGLIGFVIIKLFLYLNHFEGFFSTFIRKIGRYSLYFLCIHSIEMVAVGNYVTYLIIFHWWTGDSALRSILIIVVRLIIAISGTFSFVWIKDYIEKKHKRT